MTETNPGDLPDPDQPDPTDGGDDQVDGQDIPETDDTNTDAPDAG